MFDLIPLDQGGLPESTRPPMGADDVSLVALLEGGDVRAPRIVWHRFAPMVHRMVRRVFGPDYEIDDLVQEVFFALFKRAHTLRDPKALHAFVISITANTIRCELRRKSAAKWLRFGDAVASAEAAEADLDARQALTQLYRIVARLSSDDRTAFVLRFMEGLEVAKVARALGVSRATTKRRLSHAWQRVVFHVQRDATLMAYLADRGLGGESWAWMVDGPTTNRDGGPRRREVAARVGPRFANSFDQKPSRESSAGIDA